MTKAWTVHELQILLRGKPPDSIVALKEPGSCLINPINAENLVILEEYKDEYRRNFWSAGSVKTLAERYNEKLEKRKWDPVRG